MIHLIVTINVRAERLADFLRLVIHHRDCSRSEPGCIKFDVCRRGHAQFALYEVWFDYGALVLHRKTAHYDRWRAEIGQLEAEPRTHEEFHTLRTVWTIGCFDGPYLHAGHLKLLKEAAMMGDCFTVATNTDASVRRLKGEGRPILREAVRVTRLASLPHVSEVVTFDTEEDLRSLLRTARPDVLVKSEQWRNKEITGAEFACKMAFISEVPDCSTTLLLRKMSETAERCKRSTVSDQNATPG